MPYLRFVVAHRDENSHKRQGLFQAIRKLSDEGALHPLEQESYDEIREWFNQNLERPERFARSSKRSAKKIALSWFKDSAEMHIKKMRALAEILHAHGTLVETICTEKPGYIVYEDAFQIVAEPFLDSGA